MFLTVGLTLLITDLSCTSLQLELKADGSLVQSVYIQRIYAIFIELV